MRRTLLLTLAVTIMVMMVSCGKKENDTPKTTEETLVTSNETKTEEPPATEAEKVDEVTENVTPEVPDSTPEENGIKWEYTELEDGTISLYAYETDEIPETMEVPSVVDGKTVTGIERLFLNEENVKKVILPETLTHIGIDAFMDSVSIEEVEINSIIEHIYGGAFYHCSGIRSLAFPDGLKKIDDTGIFMSTGLEELHVPASVEMTADELSYAVILKSETTIYAPAGSVWETYANDLGLTFAAE